MGQNGISSLVTSDMSILQKILRVVASYMQTPVMIILIAFMAFSLLCLGWLLIEAVSERRHMRVSVGNLADELKKGEKKRETLIKKSGLLKKQREALLEITRHPDFSYEMLKALAENQVEQMEAYYDRILKMTDLVAKLAPMAGLLGTLIPLGPGIIALGRGDTYTLSASMLTAFDTTIAGLIAAGICLVISTIRRRWYNRYMSDVEALADCLVEIMDEKRA